MKYKIFLAILFSIAVAACGGGSTTTAITPPDITPPTVSSTSPTNSATGVAVNTAITASFSENMDAATITAASFTLNNGVIGAVTYSGTTATFTPTGNLASSTTYTATITTAVKDAAGNAMAAPYTWTFTTTAPVWTQLVPTGGPPGVRVSHTAVFNPTNNRMIVFGGLNGPGVVTTHPMFNDVWVLTNADGTGVVASTWTQLSPTGSPPSARGTHSAVYDAVNNRMMVFGGDPNIGSCFGAVNDVWVLTNADGTGGTPTWAQLSPTGGPPNLRQSPQAVYDSATNRMMVFGGMTNACGSLSNDVWVLQNANGLGGTPIWTQLLPVGGPVPRASHSAVYDSANNRMVVFGGGTATGSVNDVWVLQNANGIGTPLWTQLNPTGVPPSARSSHAAMYDLANNRMVVFGGVGGVDVSGRLNDVWVLVNANGVGTPAWTQLSPTGVPPSVRDSHTAVYNPAMNRMVVFAGRTCTGTCTGPEFSALSDIWVLQ